MFGDNFSISANEEEYCFNPLVCSTDSGHLVVWAFGVDSKESTLVACSFRENVNQGLTYLGTIGEKDQLLFLKHFSCEKYVLAIETEIGDTKLLFVNEHGTLVEEKTIKVNGELLYCYRSDYNVTLFIYNYKQDSFEIHIGEDWDSTNITTCINNVYGIPIVVPFAKDIYIAAWVTRDDELMIASGNIHGIPKTMTMKNFNVDYLLGSRVDENIAVFGGSCSRSGIVTFYYFVAAPLRSICNRVWESEDYKDKAIILTGLDRGFFLFAEDKTNVHVRMQRFTHIGTWLYPLLEMDSDDKCTWSPNLAQGNPSTLLVYIKNYEEYSQVWGKWLNIRRISEIEQLKICDVESWSLSCRKRV